MSAPPLLVRVLPEELPEAYRRLIDPDTPLAEPERFFPRPYQGGGFAKLFLLVATLMLVAFGRGLPGNLIQAFREGTGKDWAYVLIGGLMSAFFLWAVLRLIGRIRTGRRQAAEHARGRYRLGMFVAKDALLVYDGERCDLVPRERITVEKRYPTNWDGGARPSGIYLVFSEDQGREHTRRIEDPEWRGTIQHWAENGKFRRRSTSPS